MKNIHPREILLEEFIKPFKISQNFLARKIVVPPRRINEIILGKRSITSDTALRLVKFFKTSSIVVYPCIDRFSMQIFSPTISFANLN